ncbi:MAG: hypothetical protein EOO73_05395 [Myxococcales bacterium]|nr:MAG: hypothetical protein EOO73_05395 [Myxococcales bacterium]
MSDEPTDPFSVHTQLRDEEQTAELRAKFDGGEHLWLGMKGAIAACGGDAAKLAMIGSLRRPRDARPLTYGEVVALSGDFYGSAEELLLEQPAALPWWQGTNDLSALRAALGTELDWIQEEERHTRAGYPDNTLTFVWTAKSYLELAEDNTAHFGWHNVKRYCEYHAKAIEYARVAAAQELSDESWMRAMFYNGFADHFLTDAFAAGHIRVPRQQIREWAAEEQHYSGKLAGVLSKLLHDQDGHIDGIHAHGEEPRSETEGLLVRNSNDCEWRTRCDGQLFLVADKSKARQILEPVAAVAASLEEVFAAQERRVRPVGVYRALGYVPFPHPDAPTLSDKFAGTSPARIEELLKSFKWYFRLPFLAPLTDAVLNQQNVTALFQALPLLMERFRASVTAEYRESAELQRRLPRPYVEAFSNLR